MESWPIIKFIVTHYYLPLVKFFMSEYFNLCYNSLTLQQPCVSLQIRWYFKVSQPNCSFHHYLRNVISYVMLPASLWVRAVMLPNHPHPKTP